MRHFVLLAAAAVLLPLGLIGCGGGKTETPATPAQNTSGATTPASTQTAAIAGDPAQASKAAGALDLTYINSEIFAALIVHPKRLAQNPLVAVLLKDEIVAERIQKTGVDPASIEQVMVLAPVPMKPSPETGGRRVPNSPVFVIRFAQPVDGKAVVAKFLESVAPGPKGEWTETQIAGKTCYQPSGAPWVDVHLPDDKTIVLGVDGNMKRILASPGPRGPLADGLRRADADCDLIASVALEAVPEMVKTGVEELKNDRANPAAAYADLAATVRGATLTLNLSAEKLLGVVVDTFAAAEADKLESTAKEGLGQGKKALAGLQQEMPEMMKKQFGPMLNLGIQAVDGIGIEKSGSQIVLTMKRPAGLDAAVPRIVAMLKESAGAARKSVKRAKGLNSLKQITLAMHNYASVKNTFPPAVLSDKATGKPMWSWRVALLPYLEEQALFDEFHRNEPWDSPHNLAVAKQRMPSVYKAEGLAPGMTRVMVFTGKGAAFDGSKKVAMDEIKDGMSNTLMFVEAGPDKAVFWTKPEDLPFDPADPKAALGQISPEGFPAAMMDGSVRTMSPSIDDGVLKALITSAGGENAPMPAARDMR